MIKLKGDLYITQHYICFFSKIFGQKIKVIFLIKLLLKIIFIYFYYEK